MRDQGSGGQSQDVQGFPTNCPRGGEYKKSKRSRYTIPMRIVLPLLALALALPACAKPSASEPAAHPTTTSSAPATKIGGCNDVHLYAANDDATQVLIIDVDARSVGLERGQTKTFDLATTPKGVHVWLDHYLQPAHVENVHCTKTPTEEQMAERYTAMAGTLTVERAADGSVSANVEGAKFVLEGRPDIEVPGRRFDRVSLARN
jgi:hypothetical protein